MKKFIAFSLQPSPLAIRIVYCVWVEKEEFVMCMMVCKVVTAAVGWWKKWEGFD
jgi:hypothetical protein